MRRKLRPRRDSCNQLFQEYKYRQPKDGSDSQKKRRRRDGRDSGSDNDGMETFEAEGQLNLMMADSENPTDEETYLRDIWKNLGVGKNGFIWIEELEKVCKHIGMDKMTDIQLQQLFEKLDADGDGRVSFREFLNELFQHSAPIANVPTTPRSMGTTPTRALSAQKKLKFPGTAGEDRTTPSIVQGTGVTGLFSVLDPDRTGFAKTDAVTDLWEKYNVTNGVDVLLGLGFDLNTKVNLSELSAALEQELLGADEQNLMFLAATASYQQELRHLKSSLEQAAWAKEKLKLDLAEANARNNLLAKEVDERHASMEKSSELRLLSIEKKYQDQIKALQMDIDKEREKYVTFTVRHKQNTECEMESLKHEDARLREQLIQAQKEMEKLGHDLEEVTNQLDESEKQNQRYQRELETVEDLHRKLAEYESKGILSPEEQKFTQDKLHRLEHENKDLKDHNDELTAELENVKQQLVPGRKPGLYETPDTDAHTPIRKDGSVMSDYVKPVVIKKETFSSADYSDDDSQLASAQLRKLPKSPHEDDNIIKDLKKDLSEIGITFGKGLNSTTDKETIEQLRRDLQELKEHFEIDRKEIEQAYRLEIAAIEDKHDEEKGILLKHIDNEKEKLTLEFEKLQQEALAELARELQTSFAHEKENIYQKHESEKNHLEQTHAEEKKELGQSINLEFEADMQSQLQELKTKYDQERFQLEEALSETEPFIKDLERQNSHIQQTLDQQKEETKKIVDKQRLEMEELVKKHKQDIENVEKQKHELEMRFKREGGQSEMGFRREKLELNNLIDKQGQDIRELQKQKAELELELRQQREELELAFRQEKQEIKELFEDKLRELEEKLKQAEEDAVDISKGGVDSLKGKTREDFYRLLDSAREDAVQKELTKMMQGFQKQQQHLEKEFDTRKSELTHVFEKEKTELREKYEEEIKSMKSELDGLQERMEEEREALAERFHLEQDAIEEQLAQQIREELEDEFCQQMEEVKEAYDDEKREYEARANLLRDEVEELQKALDKEGQNRKKLEEMKRANSKLQQEKRQAEKGQADMQEALESTKLALEARIDELIKEKEGAITAVKTQYVESSIQSGKEKASHDTLLIEKESLERQVSQLSQDIMDLQREAHATADLQKQVELLTQENQDLISQLNKNAIPEHAERAINELTEEKCELEEKLVDTQAKLDEIEDMAKKYTHLQFDYGQMSIGQCALEESLLNTQDKLADTEATLMQAERELRDALRYKDKFKLLQKKYEDVCKERDKVSHFAKSLKEELNKANVAHKDDHEDKGRLTTVLEEKKLLEMQLQKVSDKLLEATTNFAVSQSQHIRELQDWKEQCSNMVDLQKFTKLQIDLVDNQRSVRDLQDVVKSKDELATKLFKETADKHTGEVKTLDEQKKSLERKLLALQQILDGQIGKFKDQYEAGEKRNALVVDLYKENAELMDALCHVEEQKKDAVSRCYKLEDQCNQLRKMLQRVAKVAIS